MSWRKERDHSSRHLMGKGKGNLFLSSRAQPGLRCDVSFRKPGWWLEGARVEKRKSEQEGEISGIASSSPLLTAVNKGVWDNETVQTGALPVWQCPGLPVWAELGIAEQRVGAEDKVSSLPAPHLSETFSMCIPAPSSLSGHISQACLMIPGKMRLSDEASPKLPRLGEVATLPGSITFPWCRLSSSMLSRRKKFPPAGPAQANTQT